MPSKPTKFCEAHIDDIIQLKILVAEQQATIDTQSANLHNLEVELAEHRRDPRQPLMSPNDDEPGSSHAEALEDENRRLSNKLHRSRERETSWRTELDESNREQLELEGVNLTLMQENLKLRLMLRELRTEREHVGASGAAEYDWRDTLGLGSVGNGDCITKTRVKETSSIATALVVNRVSRGDCSDNSSTTGTASVPNGAGKVNCLDKSSNTRETKDTTTSTVP